MISNKDYIYKGIVKHRRFIPIFHSFKYNIFMAYFDISKIENKFKKSIGWNVNRFALVSFYRKDYHGPKHESLDFSVRKTLKDKVGFDAQGPIRILTHLRYFGYCFNPVSFYYCFNKEDNNVDMIMAEVTNTPWNERHCYFINNSSSPKGFLKASLKKEFHVSPFWDMDHEYEWLFSPPAEFIDVNMINFKNSKKVFNAHLQMNERIEMNFYNLIIQTLQFPFLTLIIVFRIHLQAIKLWFKGAIFYNHPKFSENKDTNV